MANVIPRRGGRRPQRSGAWLAVVLAVIVAVLVLTWWRDGRSSGPSPTWTPEAPTSSPSESGPAPDPRFDTARAQLAALPVKGWDRHQDFDRRAFGKAWSDDVDVEFGRNGCNTRDDVLRRDLTDLVVRPGTCFAQTGVLHDPYRGSTIDFVRGPTTSNAVEIDHVVSLADAWYKGARQWDEQRRLDFANDPRNLLAIDPKANFAKAFRDAAGWLPPNEDFRCEFVARQVEVKTAYQLWVSENEARVLDEVLASC